jgi:hypothetical protein
MRRGVLKPGANHKSSGGAGSHCGAALLLRNLKSLIPPVVRRGGRICDFPDVHWIDSRRMAKLAVSCGKSIHNWNKSVEFRRKSDFLVGLTGLIPDSAPQNFVFGRRLLSLKL